MVILDGKREVARHHRQIRKSAQSLTLDHYLEVLAVKPGALPGALPGATALAQARAPGVFTAEHEAFWASARAAHGDAGGTRALVEVLLLHRHMAHADVIEALAVAVPVGATSADVVAVEARKIAAIRGDQPPHPVTDPAPGPRVVSLTERRLAAPAGVIAGLPPDTRPLPSVHPYDELLARRAPATTARPDQPAVTSSEGHPS